MNVQITCGPPKKTQTTTISVYLRGLYRVGATFLGRISKPICRGIMRGLLLLYTYRLFGEQKIKGIHCNKNLQPAQNKKPHIKLIQGFLWLLPDLDSNQDKLYQKQLYYPYTIGQSVPSLEGWAAKIGLRPICSKFFKQITENQLIYSFYFRSLIKPGASATISHIIAINEPVLPDIPEDNPLSL